MVDKTSVSRQLRIRVYPDDVLRQVAEPIEEIGPDIAELSQRMTDLMLESCGIGLAGPQVGVGKRIIIVSLNDGRNSTEVLINPELTGFQGNDEFEEGCLSIPGVRAKVRRPAGCSVTALNLDGSRFVLDAVDLTARVLQHEVDHLNGVLFTDRLSSIGRLACRRGLRQLEREHQRS